MDYVTVKEKLQKQTQDFSKDSGLSVFDTYDEALLGEAILKKHYDTVEIQKLNKDDEYDLRYHILYSNEPEDDFMEESIDKTYGLQFVSKADGAGFNAAMGEGFDETYEKHDYLNQDIFDGEELKKEVKEKLLQIVDAFKEFAKTDGVDIDAKDVHIVGSNVSYNYTPNSDIDCHIVADVKSEDACKLYNAYRRLWNSEYNPTIYGRDVEIYVEPEGADTKSNGVYSLSNGWIKKPTDDKMPQNIETPQLDSWMKRADDCNTVEEIDDYLSELYELRQKSLIDEGEYSEGNQLFKNLRDAGILSELKDKRIDLVNDELTLEEYDG